MLGFLIGAIAGGLAATYWHRELSSFRDQHLPRLRNQTADKLETAERTIVEGVKKVATQARTRLRREDASAPHDEDPVSDRIGGPR